jgi:hypothetical protein
LFQHGRGGVRYRDAHHVSLHLRRRRIHQK